TGDIGTITITPPRVNEPETQAIVCLSDDLFTILSLCDEEATAILIYNQLEAVVFTQDGPAAELSIMNRSVAKVSLDDR
ncbi:MAG: hypothetical protein ABI835_02035, partial [Chloroflexota bacterium]